MSGYAAARIHAMRASLIAPQEYPRLLKMTEPEIIAFLQQHDYKEDIASLSIGELRDLEEFDRVIASNHARTVRKLQRFCAAPFTDALRAVEQENDLWNLTVLAQAIVGQEPLLAALDRWGRPGTVDMRAFAACTSITELTIAASKSLPIRPVTTLAELYEAIRTVSRTSASRYDIDERNIKELLLLKREGTPADRIIQQLERGGTVPISVLRDAARATDITATVEILRHTPYAIAFAAFDRDRMIAVESALHLLALRKRRHATMARPDALLSHFLAQKGIEYANLRLLVKGRRLGLSDAAIASRMVLA